MQIKEIKEELLYIEKVKEINENKKLKYYILTMGCQLNENDSEKIAGMLESMNYERTQEMQEANLIIFNTCCVRENAEERLFGKIGEVKKQKEEKGAIIAIGGCMMQEEHILKKIKQSYPYVDIIFGTHTLNKLPQDLYEALEENKKIRDIIDIEGEVIEGLPISRDDKIKASVAIMNGCNNFCTYCIVPYVRGRERSRRPQDIINEVMELSKKGYKEIMLLGQNVNSYLVSQKAKGEDVNFKVTVNNKEMIVNSFATLLIALDEIEGIERIRFISPHPKDFTDDVIDAIKNSKHICKQIHLPLQSGSTKILKEMNRKYTKEEYLSLAEKIKKEIPEIVFSTDIIVGFPGETEDDFEDTLDVVRKVNFEQVFMFIFSRRVGTVADKMENQIHEEIKHERFNRLKELVENQMKIQNEAYVGKEVQILVEGKSKNNDKMLTGRTISNKVVNFDGTDDLIGKIINVKIISEHQWYLKGSIIA